MAQKIEKSQSMVYLPPMPKKAADILLKHNADTLKIFTTYVKTYAEQYVEGSETQLPLTQYAAGDKKDSKANGAIKGAEKTSEGLDFLPSLPAPAARSVFAALSGHGDDFPTIADLCNSSRQGIFLESAIIPHLDLHPNESRQPLNSYIMDFYNHGDLKALASIVRALAEEMAARAVIAGFSLNWAGAAAQRLLHGLGYDLCFSRYPPWTCAKGT